ncbi:hypothetical protein Tco_0551762 [Tanacetum coccineum]
MLWIASVVKWGDVRLLEAYARTFRREVPIESNTIYKELKKYLFILHTFVHERLVKAYFTANPMFPKERFEESI